jgi:hypothetical protein
LEEEEKIRGYKLTADGRKTTFFNNEMDEKTRALIGDIAPKKFIGSTDDAPLASNGGSAWNAAGTFESIDHSSWARETVMELVKAIKIETALSLLESIVLKNVKVEGDAQIIGMRGKRKHMCDLTITIDYSVALTSATDICEGQLIVNDVTSDGDEEFEIIYPRITVTFTNQCKSELASQLKIVQDNIKQSLSTFLVEYRIK